MATAPTLRPGREHALRRAFAAASSRSSRCSATSYPSTVGAALAFKRRRRAARGADVPRRGCVLGRRHARGAQPRRRLAGAGRVRDPAEPVLVLHAALEADGQSTTSRSASTAAGRSRARRVDGTDAVVGARRRARCGGARARRATGRRRSRPSRCASTDMLRTTTHATSRSRCREEYANRDPVERLEARLSAGRRHRRGAGDDARERRSGDLGGARGGRGRSAARPGDARGRRLGGPAEREQGV